jgi:hypothetical protein
MPRRRAKSRTDSSVTLFVLIILFIFGIYYSITGRDPGGVFGSGTPTAVVATEKSPAANVPTAVNASGTWWEVYFTDPVNINNPEDWQSSVEGRLSE